MEQQPALSLLENLLRRRVEIISVQRQIFAGGTGVAQSIVPTARLLLCFRGNARYTVESRTFAFRRGMMLYVDPRTRRGWTAPRTERLGLWWIEFQASAALSSRASHLLLPRCDLKLEMDAFQRLAPRTRGRIPRTHSLPKAALARSPLALHPGRRTRPAFRGAAPVRRSRRRRSFGMARPTTICPARSMASPERVRLEPQSLPHSVQTPFRPDRASSPAARLRMRAPPARCCRRRSRPIKDIALAVGYADPLFFSRHYSRFWKRTPSQDRAFSP